MKTKATLFLLIIFPALMGFTSFLPKEFELKINGNPNCLKNGVIYNAELIVPAKYKKSKIVLTGMNMMVESTKIKNRFTIQCGNGKKCELEIINYQKKPKTIKKIFFDICQ